MGDVTGNQVQYLGKTLGLFSLLALVLTPSPVRADSAAHEVKEVAVVDLSIDSRENAQVRHEVLRALRRHTGYDVRGVDSILNAGAEADEQANIRTALAFKEAGTDALDRGDASEASDQLDNAAGLIERNFGQLPDVKVYRELLLMLGDAQLAAGLRDTGRETFDRAALFRARPGDVSRGMSAKAEAALNQAVSAMADAAPGAIYLSTSPAHAEVWVNGRYKGITPKTVAGLPEGKHLLVIRKPGYVRQTLEVRSDPTELTTYSFDMEPSRKKPVWDQLRVTLEEEVLATGLDTPQAGRGVEQMGSVLLADLGLVVRCGGEGSSKEVELSLYHPGSRRLLNRITRAVNWKTRNRAGVESLVHDLLDIDFVTALGGASEAEMEGSPLYKKWWFWGAVAAGIAGMSTAAILVSNPQEPPPRPTEGTIVLTF